MTKKLSALMMALILVCAGAVGSASAEETLSCFVPNEVVDAYNSLMYSTLIDYGFGEEEDLLECKFRKTGASNPHQRCARSV